jgi:ABC-2 type transport system ATP-binding protein
MDAVLEARGLSKHFGAHVALEDMDLALPAGEIFGLLGPQRRGQEHHDQPLHGLLAADRGEARVCGLDCSRDTRDVMRVVGHMPEEPSLFDNLTGRETVAFVLSMRGEDTPARRDEVQRTAERLGFAPRWTSSSRATPWACARSSRWCWRSPTSRGCCCSTSPPTASTRWWPGRCATCSQERAARGVTVVLSTHLLDVAQRVCHRLGLIVQGRLRAVGTPDEVLRQAGAGSLEDAFLALTTAP